MEKFKIYGYTNLVGEAKEVVITDSENLSEASTFDEKLSIAKHDKISFTFKIAEKLSNGRRNPYFDLIRPESVIGLSLPDRTKFTEAKTDKKGAYYKLKVVERIPSFSKESLIYEITCEDFASRVYSKQGESLFLEQTGTLREIAEAILGETRKNILYKDLNKDISKMLFGRESSQQEVGFEYQLPYVNYNADNMLYFLNNGSYVSFSLNNGFAEGQTYDLHFDLIGANFRTNQPIALNFDVVSRTGSTEHFISETIEVAATDKAIPITIPFTFLSGGQDLELRVHESSKAPWPKTSGQFSLSLANFRITKNKTRVSTRKDGDTALFINHLDNFAEQFSTSDSRYYSETRMTYSISNSNLYNALVSLAELFDAQVKFDYLDNAIFFEHNQAGKFKGYRLHPDVNLNSISRPETSADFATVFHLEGGSDIDGVIPSIPREWRAFLTECVENNFQGDWFPNYSKSSNYSSYTNKVKSYIDLEDSREERESEIEKFAAHMDKIPNFESTAYDFSYFRKINLLTEAQYNELLNVLFNEVRKINISLNVMTYQYYTLYSSFTSQLMEVAFYIGAINTERKFQYNAAKKVYGKDAPQKYTSSWVSYMNNIDASVAAERNYVNELESILGFREDGSLDIGIGSFTYNSLSLFGYKSKEENGIVKLLEENSVKSQGKLEDRRRLKQRKEQIEEEINHVNTSSFMKESLSVELAGTNSALDSVSNYLGLVISDTQEEDYGFHYPGVYTLESNYYGKLLQALPSKVNLPGYLSNRSASLHELIVDRDNPHNLINKKESALEILLDKYEPFNLEARYQNADEPTPYGLLEQGLTSFTKFNRPQVLYNISSINIGAIEEYSFYKHPEIGDKILLDDEFYFTYDEEETNHLIITGYNEELRNPSSLTLEVEKDDESELLVRRMLERTNFVSLGRARTKSALLAPVPNELKEDMMSVSEIVEELRKSNISVFGLFTGILKG